MKLRNYIELALVLVICLFVTATYVGHMDKVALMQERGVWTVELTGTVYLTGGVVYPVISTFDADYNAYPELPSYMDYLANVFPGESTSDAPTSEDDAFVTVEIVVTAVGDGIAPRVILSDSFEIAFPWTGGAISDSGEIGTYSYTLGPHIAYYEYSPYKLTAVVTVVDEASIKDVCYLTLPDLTNMEGLIG